MYPLGVPVVPLYLLAMLCSKVLELHLMGFAFTTLYRLLSKHRCRSNISTASVGPCECIWEGTGQFNQAVPLDLFDVGPLISSYM